MEYLYLIIKLILALIFIFGLMFLLAKLGNNQVDRMNNSRYIKVIEKTNISKENSIMLLKIGKKGYVVASSNKGLEKLEEVSEEDIEKIEVDKRNQKEVIKDEYEKLLNKFDFLKKEDKYEE